MTCLRPADHGLHPFVPDAHKGCLVSTQTRRLAKRHRLKVLCSGYSIVPLPRGMSRVHRHNSRRCRRPCPSGGMEGPRNLRRHATSKPSIHSAQQPHASVGRTHPLKRPRRLDADCDRQIDAGALASSRFPTAVPNLSDATHWTHRSLPMDNKPCGEPFRNASTCSRSDHSSAGVETDHNSRYRD